MSFNETDAEPPLMPPAFVIGGAQLQPVTPPPPLLSPGPGGTATRLSLRLSVHQVVRCSSPLGGPPVRPPDGVAPYRTGGAPHPGRRSANDPPTSGEEGGGGGAALHRGGILFPD